MDKPRGKPFAPGNNMNPKGRPPGSKNKLQEDFLRDMCAAWSEHGQTALNRVAIEEPAKFVQVAASILPKEAKIEIDHNYVVHVPKVAETIEEWLKPSRGSPAQPRNLNS